MSKSKPVSVLVVEDDEALSDAYEMILASAGHDVTRAFNGREALEQTEQQDFDIILLDLRMPVLDGIGFLREFKPTEHPETSVVVFSNYDTHKDIDEAYELGVERYVLKARAAPKDLLNLVQGIVAEKFSDVVA